MPIGRSHPSHSPPGSVGEPGQRAFGRCQQFNAAIEEMGRLLVEFPKRGNSK